MDITELNAKLVSELREIAKLIGITNVDKLRKQDIIKKIVANADEQEANAVSTEAASSPEETKPNEANNDQSDHANKPRRRTRLAKTAQPLGPTETNPSTFSRREIEQLADNSGMQKAERPHRPERVERQVERPERKPGNRIA